jgi:hypothetical protein
MATKGTPRGEWIATCYPEKETKGNVLQKKMPQKVSIRSKNYL